MLIFIINIIKNNIIKIILSYMSDTKIVDENSLLGICATFW